MTEATEKKVTLGQAIIILGITMVVLMLFARNGGDFRIAVLMTWVIIFVACLILRISWAKIFEACVTGIGKAMGALIILMLVGAIIGSWMTSGTIAYVIRAGLLLVDPRVFYLATLILTSLMSVFTGTSLGSAGTAGVAMVSVGMVMGMNPGITAGAVICGASFGDKMSPLSDTTNMCPVLTGGTLFRHIQSMLYTTVIPYLFCIVFFLVLGISHGSGNADLSNVHDAVTVIEGNFKISIIVTLPIILVIILLILKMEVVPAMLLSIMSAVLISWLYQGVPLVNTMNNLWRGFAIKSGNSIIDTSMSRGGITMLAPNVILMILAVGMGSMFEKLGVLDALIGPFMEKLNSVVRMVLMGIGVSFATGMLTTTMTASEVITARVLAKPFHDKGLAPEVLSRTIEDCCTLGAVLIPWHVMVVYYAGVLSISYLEFLPYLPICYLAPIFAVLCALTGKGIWYIDKEGNRISKEEHRKLYTGEFALK